MYISQSSMRRNLLFVFISFVITIFSCSVIRGYDAGDPIPETDYLTFTANEAGATISFKPLSGTAEYSVNGGTWTQVDNTNGSTVELPNAEDFVKFRGNDIKTYAATNNFKIIGSVSASGCVDSLRLDKGKFQGLTENCYNNMFRNCIGLISAPTLPATTLEKNCYISMFGGTGLTTPPELPAKGLKAGCYRSMFTGCQTLATVPKLPATNLATNCYMEMFSGCTKLKDVPSIPAETLATECYNNMFKGCTELQLSTEQVGDYQYEWKFKATQDNVDSKYSTMFDSVTIQGGTPTPNNDGYVTLYSKYPVGIQNLQSEPVLIGYISTPLVNFVGMNKFVIDDVIVSNGQLPKMELKWNNGESISSIDIPGENESAYILVTKTDGTIVAATKEFNIVGGNEKLIIPSQTLYTDFSKNSAATGANDKKWNDKTPRVYYLLLTILPAA